MKAYKGFNTNMTCNPTGKKPFQYEEGKEYEESEASLCNSGFHACLNPLDCFRHYAPGTSVYYEVELDDVSDERENDDTKVCGKKIKIGAALDVAKICRLHFEYVNERCEPVKSKHSTGNYSAASNTGYYSAASNTGYRSAASNTGDYSAASNTGYRSAASNTGNYSAASNTGYRSAASNTGNYSAASNTGNYSAASNTGNYSAASNTGDYSAASVSGIGSVALTIGYKGKVKANVGSAIVCCEHGEWNGKEYPLVAIKSAIVDGKKIKADTWYTLENGKFVEVKDEK